MTIICSRCDGPHMRSECPTTDATHIKVVDVIYGNSSLNMTPEACSAQARRIAAALIAAGLIRTVGQAPQDLPMTNAAPVIKSFSQSTRDERCLEVWFDKEVTDAGRSWLLEAINEKALRVDAPSPPKLDRRQDCCDLTASVPCEDCPQRKPDAWQIRDKHGRWITLPGDWHKSENIEGREYRPLYAKEI